MPVDAHHRVFVWAGVVEADIEGAFGPELKAGLRIIMGLPEPQIAQVMRRKSGEVFEVVFQGFVGTGGIHMGAKNSDP